MSLDNDRLSELGCCDIFATKVFTLTIMVWGDDQLVMCVPHKLEDLSSIPAPTQKARYGSCACNSGTGVQSQSVQISELHFQQETLSQKKKNEVVADQMAQW